MSIIKAIRHQLGLSTTPSNNFTWDSSADNGTIRMYRGNAGTPIQDILTVSATNVVTAASGAVLAPSGPAFRAFAGSATTALTATDGKINFDAKNFDTANAFDLATDRFQPLVAGYYQIGGGFIVSTGTSVILASIYKNGSLNTVGPTPTANRTAVSDLVFLNGTTDFVELFGASITAQSTGTLTMNTYFYGYLVRAA